ncbi:MAG TPA: hypothetical protein VFC79_13290 [Tissierellaceae bacterium]|nr:hypothetical protein [Tissierellaceae bacterium]
MMVPIVDITWMDAIALLLLMASLAEMAYAFHKLEQEVRRRK